MTKLGYAVRDITPDMPCFLAGYAHTRACAGVHDPLYARALVFAETGRAPVILLQLDLLNLDNLSYARLLERLQPLGIQKEQLLICCSHTHSAFGGIFDTEHGINRELKNMLGEQNEVLLNFLTERCAAVIKAAQEKMHEVKARVFQGTITGVGTNRHAADIASDTGLFAIEFFLDNGEKLLLYNLSCHPTVLGANNKLISADIPGAVNAKLQTEYGSVVFINGSCGDMSTRFTRKESSFSECDRLADLIVAKLKMFTASAAPSRSLPGVSLRYRTICLEEAPVEDYETATEKLRQAEQHLESVKQSTDDPKAIRIAESFVEGAMINQIKSQYCEPSASPEIAVEAGFLSLCGRTVVCSPFELFSSLALQLKHDVAVEMFGYVNALNGYLADSEAYDSMEYEAVSSRFKQGQGERYVALVRALLNEGGISDDNN